jgi:type III secretion system HrpE/YscL family protein
VNAREQARAIVERAQEMAVGQRARATEEGRTQGRSELAAELIAFTRERERTLRALEAQTIDIAMQVAKRIIGEELALRPELAAQMARPLLARVRRAKQVTLRVHPDDRAALEPLLRHETKGGELPGGLRLEADASLSRGGCVVISDVGTLDARIETQLDALARALLSS